MIQLNNYLFLIFLLLVSGNPEDAVKFVQNITHEKPSPPIYLGEPQAHEGATLLRDGDSTIIYIYRNGDWDTGGFSNAVFYRLSDDEGRTWTEEKVLLETPGNVAQSFSTISPISGEIMVFYIDRGNGVICARSENNRKTWTFTPMNLPDSSALNTSCYGNALWVNIGDKKRVLSGFHGGGLGAGVFYSDDDGHSWKSSARVNVPNTIPNIWQTGAVEPSFAELSNGDILMYLRNSNFNIWKSVSKDKGVSWSDPEKTNLYCGDNSWITLKNLSKNRLILIWNNAKALRPEVTQDKWNFTGREVLHIAISEDQGNTWIGYRELMLDRLRDSMFVNHPGDKGLNESKLVETHNGNVLVLCGQAEGHRSFVLVDPNWIYERKRYDDFSNGISQWSRQKIMIRPAVYNRWYHHNYERKPGAVLVAHPNQQNKQVLHVRRPIDTTVYSQRDGAVWNFPAGKRGYIKTRIRLNKGFKGCSIALNDRWFQPIDNQGRSTAMHVLEIPGHRKLNDANVLLVDSWITIKMAWDHLAPSPICQVFINNKSIKDLELMNPCSGGISYLRFRSASRNTDNAGIYIESVSAEVY